MGVLKNLDMAGAQALATNVILQTKRDIEAGYLVNANGTRIKGTPTDEERKKAWQSFLDNTIWLLFFPGLQSESLYGALDLENVPKGKILKRSL